MADYPVMQWYPRDWIADTRSLTHEERGIYFDLINFCWLDPDCSLADDDANFCRLLSVRYNRWMKIRQRLSHFFTIENGRWVQKRLQKERRKTIEKVQKNRANGSRGGRTKALNAKQTALANASQTLERKASKAEAVKVKVESYSNSESESQTPESHTGKSPPSATVAKAAIAEQMVEVYHRVCGDLLPRVVKITPSRQQHLLARYTDLGRDMNRWELVCRRARASPFLTGMTPGGNGHAPFRANIDFIIRQDKFVRLSEGCYDDRNVSRSETNEQWASRLAEQHAERRNVH